MISLISLSNEIFEALYRAREIEDREFEEVLEWITDIVENPDRPKLNYCEICGHSDNNLEKHHVRGRKYGNECITACLECHKVLTDKQRLWNYDNPENLLTRGLNDIFELKYSKTGIELFKRTEDNLTASFEMIP